METITLSPATRQALAAYSGDPERQTRLIALWAFISERGSIARSVADGQTVASARLEALNALCAEVRTDTENGRRGYRILETTEGYRLCHSYRRTDGAVVWYVPDPFTVVLVESTVLEHTG